MSTSSTKAISVQTSCPKGTTQLTGINILGAVSASGLTRCYTQTGSADDSTPSGKVAVAVSCRSGYYVAADSFDTTDETKAYPALSAKTFVFSSGSKVPTGVQFEAQGEQSKYYTLRGSITCCPKS